MKSRQVAQDARKLRGQFCQNSSWAAALVWPLAILSACAVGTAAALAAIPPSERPRLDGPSAQTAAPVPSQSVSQADDARIRAEDLSRAAGHSFDQIAGPTPKIFGDNDDEAASERSAGPRDGPRDGLLAPVLGWLQRATGDYHAIVVRQLSDQPAGVGDEPVDVSQAEPSAAPSGGVVPPVRREKPAAPSGELPAAPTPASPPAAKPAEPKAQVQPPTADKTPAAEKSSPLQESGGIFGTIQDWLARANREYQGVVVKQLSLPPGGPAPGGVAEDAIAKKIEETKGDDAAKSSTEAKQREDDRRRAAETKRLADEARKKADEILKAEPAKKPEPVNPSAPPPAEAADAARQALRAAEQKLAEQRLAEQKQAEELRRVEQQKRADEARRQQDDQRKLEARIAEERRIAEEAARSRNTARTIVITPEPIPRPAAVGTVFRPELARNRQTRLANNSDASDEVTPQRRRIRIYREATYRGITAASFRPVRGTAVKRWVWRANGHACRQAGRRVTPPARYTIQRGDSLWRISARHYNQGRLYPRIYRANRSMISDPDLIYPCQRVLVPRRR